jgi:hypothetical protein
MAPTLLFSPLSDTEVYHRTDVGALVVAQAAARGDHEPDTWARPLFDESVETFRTLHAATEQRVYKRPGGLADLMTERAVRS